MKRLQIQTLRVAELTAEQVAEQAQVSQRTVYRVSAEPPITSPEASDAAAHARLGRKSAVLTHKEEIHLWLAADPGLTTIGVLERLRENYNYRGGKSAVYDLVKQIRPPKPPEGIVRFESAPSEFSQHDFGEITVHFTRTGERKKIIFFASRLKFSRLMRVKITKDQRVESVCEGLVDTFTYFEGMPLLAVFDNPKTITIGRKDEKVVWNSTFAEFTVECGFCPHVTAPYRPQEKGSVENLVGFVKSSFFKVHQFYDSQDLEEKLEHWHIRVNNERPSRATGEIPRTRWLLEKARLRPMKIDPQNYTLRETRIVRTDGMVVYEGRRFFVGMIHIGQTVELRIGKETIKILRGKANLALHPRYPMNGKYSVLPEQRAELLTKDGARPFAKRQFLMDMCPAAHWLLTEIRHRRAEWWEQEVDDLYALFEEFGEAAVRDAMIEASRRGTAGAEYVEAILRGQASDCEVHS